MLSDARFSEEVLESYAPGHEKRLRAVLHDENICDTPESLELDAEFCVAKDWFTADLFRSYGFDELALVLLAAPEEFRRRENESREFIGRRHHFGTAGYCWCGSDQQPTRIDGDDIELPDLLPELAQSAMASA